MSYFYIDTTLPLDSIVICMSGRTTASSHRPSSQSKDDVPLGIIVIAVLGLIVTVLGSLGALGMLAQSGGSVAVGLLVLGMSGAQLLVLLGLLALEPWAWTWGLVLFGFGALMDLVELDIVSLIISLAIIFYLISKADYYR
ncbi:Uncharacterized membrane protein, DUF2068 [Halorhabdus sp. SVX81]|nr:Uncharacterized membrane protein, DUF2068 [Halorhabdus sp. SVX81]